MTVDEAIKKLQEISTQGNGDLHLAFYVSPERRVVWFQEVSQIEVIADLAKFGSTYAYDDDKPPTPFVKLDY